MGVRSSLFTNTLKILQNNHIHTSAYFSRSNGKIERKFRDFNATLKLLKAQVRHWSHYWPYYQFIANHSPRENLNGFSSFEVMYGRMAYDPFINKEFTNEFKLKDRLDHTKAISTFFEELHPKLTHEMQERHKYLISKTESKPIENIKPGTKCLIYKPHISNGKLSIHYTGPYEIIRQRYKDSYEIKCNKSNRTFFRNIEHIRILENIDPPKFSAEN